MFEKHCCGSSNSGSGSGSSVIVVVVVTVVSRNRTMGRSSNRSSCRQQPAATCSSSSTARLWLAVVQSICARNQAARVDHRVRWRRRWFCEGASWRGASWCGAQRPVTIGAWAPCLQCRRRVQGKRTIAQGAPNAHPFRPSLHGAQMRGLRPLLMHLYIKPTTHRHQEPQSMTFTSKTHRHHGPVLAWFYNK